MAQANAKPQAKSKKNQVYTSARGGPVRVVFGCLLIGIGFAWTLALTLGSVSSWISLRLLRDTANGLGGALCGLLPVFALWGGALLCMSARGRITTRAYWIVLSMYWCLLAILTLATSVSSRDNTLMDYIANSNRNMLGLINNTSYGAYLVGAYNLRAFYSGQLAGGGLLGMLLAWPLYQVFDIVGAVVLLIGIEGILLLVLFRVNLAVILKNASDRRHAQHTAAQRVPQTPQEPQTGALPPEHPVHQHTPEPIIQPQTVHYTATTYVQDEPEESYLVQDDAPAYSGRGERARRGFVAVEPGVLHEEHIPVDDSYAPPEEIRRPRKKRTQEKTEPERSAAAAMDTQKRAPETPPAREMPAAPAQMEEEDVPWFDEAPAPAAQTDAVPEKAAQTPARRTTVRSSRHVSGEVKQVFTDPAVPLTGERIPIQSYGTGAGKTDPLAAKHTAAPIAAVEGEYHAPPLYMLKDPEKKLVHNEAEDHERAEVLERTLHSFNIDAQVVRVLHGPTITRFALQLAEGVNVNRLGSVANNLALALKANGVLFEIPIAGTSLVGVEVPNQHKTIVRLKEVLSSEAMRANPSPTLVALGMDIAGEPVLCDLSQMPHLLVAGATGSGKSVCINTIIQSILYRATPQQVRLLMIDPKMVELQPYNGIPHLLTEVVVDPKRAAASLDWLVQEMEDRYRRIQKAFVRNIEKYNEKVTDESEKMPAIVAIIDEFSDLMIQCRKDIEDSIQRLAAKARAAGIYLVVATQRPSVDVITGVIKANIPSRIAFAVANNADSRTIIDAVGAEKLLGKGDMLYHPASKTKPVRVQGCFVSDDEVTEITDYLRAHNESNYDERVDEHMEQRVAEQEKAQAAQEHEDEPEYQANTENELLQRAIEMAVESGQMSISMLRRRLGLGHSRAGKLVDTMADMGIISSEEGPKPRRTLITREDYARMQAEIADE